jgi:hypothetical protein
MSEYVKGNYPLAKSIQTPASSDAAPSLEETLEAEALQKLGGSIAFVKKSSAFVWKGGTGDDGRPATR